MPTILCEGVRNMGRSHALTFHNIPELNITGTQTLMQLLLRRNLLLGEIYFSIKLWLKLSLSQRKSLTLLTIPTALGRS